MAERTLARLIVSEGRAVPLIEGLVDEEFDRAFAWLRTARALLAEGEWARLRRSIEAGIHERFQRLEERSLRPTGPEAA